jgi:hypothetical protein
MESIKQLKLRCAFEKERLNKYQEIAISSGKTSLRMMLEAFEEYTLDMEYLSSVLLAHKLKLKDFEEEVSLYRALQYLEKYRSLLKSSLETQMPDVYTVTMSAYLELIQEVDSYMTSTMLTEEEWEDEEE